MKKVIFGAVILSLGTLVALTQQKSEVQTNIQGLPVGSALTAPMTPPYLTRDQLYTRGHAEDYVEISELFYTYIWYHDSGNGIGVGSLFTPDGVFEVLNNKDGRTIDPDYGDFKGCIARGPNQIAQFFGATNGKLSARATPFPRPTHNQVTNILIKFDGDTAVLHANWTSINADPERKKSPNAAYVDRNGVYVADLRRTPDGWRFVQLRPIHEYAPIKTTQCDANGVLPR
jgi:SnoaL-like domain